jgi:hypothetical protein
MSVRPDNYGDFARGAGLPNGKLVDEIEDDEPGPDDPYQAFLYERGSRTILALHIAFNGAEMRKYGKQKIQFQYGAMCVDDKDSGLAADGRSFSFVFGDLHCRRRLTVRGRNLEKGWRYLSFHKVKRILSADRDVAKDGDPIITAIEIEEIAE